MPELETYHESFDIRQLKKVVSTQITNLSVYCHLGQWYSERAYTFKTRRNKLAMAKARGLAELGSYNTTWEEHAPWDEDEDSTLDEQGNKKKDIMYAKD